MASTINYLNYILNQLSDLDNITYKKMMGEFLLYYDGILIGGIYDDRFLIKKTKSNEAYNLKDEVPYDGAKSMWLVSNIDDKKETENLVLNAYNDLLK